MNDDGNHRIHHLRPLAAAPPPPRGRGTGLREVSGRNPLAEANGSGPSGPDTDAITRAIVGLVRARTGRGPPRAKTALSSGMAVVTLGAGLTRVERTLADDGEGALALRVRKALYQGMRADAVEAVEAITGQEVVAYLTDVLRDPDLAVIAFVFGPSA